MLDTVYTAEASPNIAFIKYWGRRQDLGNLPYNSSISMTLDPKLLNTRTSVLVTQKLKEDALYINGEMQKLSGSESQEKVRFISNTLNELRARSKTKGKVMVVSQNSFPTGSGMASSASGAVALVEALVPALDLKMTEAEKSAVARKISGSACRSFFGGIVKWNVGKKADGSDSYAEQVFNEKYWPELIDIITVVDASKKKVSSSEGHSLTAKTSVLYKERIKFAEEGVGKVIAAIRARDFDTLALAIMRDSNNMHATMLDTWPPIMYLADASREIIYAVHEMNDEYGKCVAAYTFDAGPNAHIITIEEHRKMVLERLGSITGITNTLESHQGAGPMVVSNQSSLIDIDLLQPKTAEKKKKGI